MRHFRMLVLIGAMLLTGAAASNAQVSFGITIGRPPAPRVVRVRPRQPGPDYMWVAGYWYPERGHYKWVNGYWTKPPYAGSRWVEPRYDGGQFFAGYWDGPKGRFEHDHRWDRDRNHDYNRYRDNDNNHNNDNHDHH